MLFENAVLSLRLKSGPLNPASVPKVIPRNFLPSRLKSPETRPKDTSTSYHNEQAFAGHGRDGSVCDELGACRRGE